VDPLIIVASEPNIDRENHPFTATPSPDELEREIDYLVGESVAAAEAGAAIVHLHGISVYDPAARYGVPGPIEIEATAELFRRIARKTAAIREYAKGSMPLPIRTDVARRMGAGKFETGNVVMSDVDFADRRQHMMWSRERIREALEWNRDMGVLPELEVFQVGATWNVRWAAAEGLLPPPIWVNLLCEAPGFNWAPGTMDSIRHRAAYLPAGSLYQTTIYTEPRVPFGVDDANALLLHVIASGAHVRIGKEDRAWLRPNEPVKSNAELVELVVWMARRLGRPVATPEQTRAMLGIPRPNF
jgi:3-keto-5-aminohexanoate cleavage enzyme